MPKLNYKAELQLDVTTKLDELKALKGELKNIQEYKVSGAGAAASNSAKTILKELKKIEEQDTKGMTIEQLEERQRKLNALKNEYLAIMNRISGAGIAQLDKNKEEIDALEAQNKKYKTQSALLKRLSAELQEIADKSKAVTESLEEVKDKTKLTATELLNPTKVQGRMAAIQGSKDPTDKKEYLALEKHNEILLKYNIQNANSINTMKTRYREVSAEIENTNEELKQTREEKQKIVQGIIDRLKEEGKITEDQKERLQQLAREQDAEEQLTEEKKKQKNLETGAEIEEQIDKTNKLTQANERVKKSFLGKVTAATVYYAALRALRRLMSSIINTVRELDKSVTEVAMVTNLNRKQTWELVDAYQNLAYEVGATTDEIARLSVYFFRQGRSAKDALELTRVAAIAAKVAAIDMSESANYLTSAINGFGLAADQALEVSDKFAALGASSASSYEEMAIALSKVAPVAKTAGVGIDFMMGVLAKGIETTREAPENIGTAFKTVFARMTQIREFGATLDDATGVNKVEEALKQAGVALRDSEGLFRNMDVVLTELGLAFDSLDRNQQAYIATALAGTRQQSRLLAVMQNFDRTLELVNTSLGASGATLAQQAEYLGGMQAATARLTTS